MTQGCASSWPGGHRAATGVRTGRQASRHRVLPQRSAGGRSGRAWSRPGGGRRLRPGHPGPRARCGRARGRRQPADQPRPGRPIRWRSNVLRDDQVALRAEVFSTLVAAVRAAGARRVVAQISGVTTPSCSACTESDLGWWTDATGADREAHRLPGHAAGVGHARRSHRRRRSSLRYGSLLRPGHLFRLLAACTIPMIAKRRLLHPWRRRRPVRPGATSTTLRPPPCSSGSTSARRASSTSSTT